MEKSMNKLARTACALTLMSLGATANADLSDVPSGKYSLDLHHAYISFSYSHMGFSTPNLGFREFDATLDLDSDNLENSAIDVVIDATSIDSMKDDFNGHLNGADFFDTANFPQATFKSTKIESTGADTFNVMGDLTIKGVTKPVTLAATINKAAMHPMQKKPTVGFSAETTIMRSEFGLGKYVPNVGDEVTIHVTVEMMQQ
jgi:polyisoprenoid-binding protein YceI